MSFPCIKCGICCKHISLIPELSDFVLPNGSCKHLKNDLCDIYEERPIVCNTEKLYKDKYSNYTKEEFEILILKNCLMIMNEEINKLKQK